MPETDEALSQSITETKKLMALHEESSASVARALAASKQTIIQAKAVLAKTVREFRER